MAIYKGNAQLRIDNAGLGTRVFYLRTANSGILETDLTPWQLDPGAAITLYFRNATAGASPPGAPDAGFVLIAYYETGTGTVVRTLYSAASNPADGTTYAFYGTDDGTVTGNPIAGTLRLYIGATRTAIPAYSRNSDGTGGSGLSANLTDQGVLQVGCNVDSIAVQAYPAGSTFAYTQAGEAVTVTATHTPRMTDTNVETVAIDALDGTAVQATGSNVEVGAGTTAQNFTVNDTNFDAASKSYGAEFRVVGNSGLVPTSGAIPWTYLIDNGANVEANGLKMRRQSFYTVDPRFTIKAGGANGFHFQVNQAAFDTSYHVASKTMLASDVGQAAARFLNARDEGINGLTVTLTADPANPGSTVTVSGITTATLDGEAGWTTLIDVCPNGKPGGTWALAADITAPAGADDPAYIVNPTDSITVSADDPTLRVRVEAGDPTAPDDHWTPGDPLVVGITATRRTRVGSTITKTRLTIDANTATFALASFNYALGRLETLNAAKTGWEVTDTPALFSCTVSAGDSKLMLYSFTAEETAQWGANRGGYFVDGGCEVGGIYKGGGGKFDSLGIYHLHSDAPRADNVTMLDRGRPSLT